MSVFKNRYECFEEFDTNEHIDYYNSLWNMFVNESDCTNKFGFNGKKVCVEIPKFCHHINKVTQAMKKKLDF